MIPIFECSDDYDFDCVPSILIGKEVIIYEETYTYSPEEIQKNVLTECSQSAQSE